MEDVFSTIGTPPIILVDVRLVCYSPVFLIAEDDFMPMRLTFFQQSGAILNPGGPHLISKNVMFVEAVGFHHLQVTVDGTLDSGAADFALLGKDAPGHPKRGPDGVLQAS